MVWLVGCGFWIACDLIYMLYADAHRTKKYYQMENGFNLIRSFILYSVDDIVHISDYVCFLLDIFFSFHCFFLEKLKERKKKKIIK